MDYFVTAWLPNIVCTLAAWGIGWLQGRRVARLADKHTLMLENVLVGLEKLGALELVRDSDGRITGGRNITVNVDPIEFSLSGGTATFTVGRVEPHVQPDAQ